MWKRMQSIACALWKESVQIDFQQRTRLTQIESDSPGFVARRLDLHFITPGLIYMELEAAHRVPPRDSPRLSASTR